MATSNIKTPGVYINEIDAFPKSIAPVATAIPAFIGYTPQAEFEGKSYSNKAQKISSFAEFQAIYAIPDPPAPADPARQYDPQYYLVPQDRKPDRGAYIVIQGKHYSILPDPNTIYYLYNSLRLFYENGGGDAYIVSVGPYGPSSSKPLPGAGEQIVNPNVVLRDLQTGLALLKNEAEPTMYICPEATLLNVAENGTLMESMLLQAEEIQTAVCIFDIIGGRDPDPIMYEQDIKTFRNHTGSQGLSYGISYYPFVCTTIMQDQDIDFSNLFGGDIRQLAALINPPGESDPAVAKIIDRIENPPAKPLPNSRYYAELISTSKTYSQIINKVLSEANILPASGGMAGVYTTVDNGREVWEAPANVSIVGVAGLPIRLTGSQQESLNVDASGKSINAFRAFLNLGIVVCGARTLDGNSLDWRYVSVRRTMIMLKQSAKLGMGAYVFEPNDANTWTAISSKLEMFLTHIWRRGGLQGEKAADSFQVRVGLGSTMTEQDIQNGIMRVSIAFAPLRPAEFIIITLEQKMAQS